MKILFSPDYKGATAWLGMQPGNVAMGTKVANYPALLTEMELRLGVVSPRANENRLVEYYQCVDQYMQDHSDNILSPSYQVAPLATAAEMLGWRDALAECRFSAESDIAADKSEKVSRLKVLQEVEKLYAELDLPDTARRIAAIQEQLKKHRGAMKGITIEIPFDETLLPHSYSELLRLANEDGAVIKRTAMPEIEGDNNLARLKKMLLNEKKDVEFSPIDKDDSLRIWRFRDRMNAAEYIATLKSNEFDVVIEPDTKLLDNYLTIMGRPVTGSEATNAMPAPIQLFFTGMAMMKRPFNIGALVEWLNLTINPLRGLSRGYLAQTIAKNGGWCETDMNGKKSPESKIIDDWIAGEWETKHEKPITEDEKDNRRHLREVFLPPFLTEKDAEENAKPENDQKVQMDTLQLFLDELDQWASKQAAISEDEGPKSEYYALSELCQTMTALTGKQEELKYSEIEKHMACLYSTASFPQYQAQTESFITVSQPGQIVRPADKVLWAGLDNYTAAATATDFLMPSEREELTAKELQLDNPDSARRIQQETMLLPLRFCQKQLTIVIIDEAEKHPLMVRIEKQAKNPEVLVAEPKIDEKLLKEAMALTDNDRSNESYVTIEHPDLIKWPEKEYYSSLKDLIQNPLDYVYNNLVSFKGMDTASLNDTNRYTGNVAHEIIARLFVADEEDFGRPEKIEARVEKDYEKVFREALIRHGAILFADENKLEYNELHSRLRDNIKVLIGIMRKNNLHVEAAEQNIEPLQLGTEQEGRPMIGGRLDLTLADREGRHVLIDLKWGPYRYDKKLTENRAAQLAIYTALLKSKTDDREIPTGYFVMPNGRLYTTHQFQRVNVNDVQVVDIDKDKAGDLMERINNSYIYRRQEIEKGRIEKNGVAVAGLDYHEDTEEKNLFPLAEYENLRHEKIKSDRL